jgi:hypothetical protein
MSDDTKCDHCHRAPKRHKERYCKDCRKAILAALKEARYLTLAPRFVGAWSGAHRTGEMRENRRETAFGRDG